MNKTIDETREFDRLVEQITCNFQSIGSMLRLADNLVSEGNQIEKIDKVGLLNKYLEDLNGKILSKIHKPEFSQILLKRFVANINGFRNDLYADAEVQYYWQWRKECVDKNCTPENCELMARFDSACIEHTEDHSIVNLSNVSIKGIDNLVSKIKNFVSVVEKELLEVTSNNYDFNYDDTYLGVKLSDLLFKNEAKGKFIEIENKLKESGYLDSNLKWQKNQQSLISFILFCVENDFIYPAKSASPRLWKKNNNDFKYVIQERYQKTIGDQLKPNKIKKLGIRSDEFKKLFSVIVRTNQ